MKPFVAAYDEVADAYSRALDPDGAGLVDPVLTELLGEVEEQDVLSLACGQGQDARLRARLRRALGASGALFSLAGALVGGVAARAVGVTTMPNVAAGLVIAAGVVVLRALRD